MNTAIVRSVDITSPSSWTFFWRPTFSGRIAKGKSTVCRIGRIGTSRGPTMAGAGSRSASGSATVSLPTGTVAGASSVVIEAGASGVPREARLRRAGFGRSVAIGGCARLERALPNWYVGGDESRRVNVDLEHAVAEYRLDTAGLRDPR